MRIENWFFLTFIRIISGLQAELKQKDQSIVDRDARINELLDANKQNTSREQPDSYFKRFLMSQKNWSTLPGSKYLNRF